MKAPTHLRNKHKIALYTYAKIIETWVSMGYPPLSKVANMLDTSPEVCSKAIGRYLNKGVIKTTTLRSKV